MRADVAWRIVCEVSQHEQPGSRLRIEFDPASLRIRGRVVTERSLGSFDGWMQLTALLEEAHRCSPPECRSPQRGQEDKPDVDIA